MSNDELPATRNAIRRLHELSATQVDRWSANGNGNTVQAPTDAFSPHACAAVPEEGETAADPTVIDGATSLQLTLEVPTDIAEMEIRLVLRPLHRSLTTTIACGCRSDASSPREIGP